MDNYEITNKDLQNIEELIGITQRIKYLYDKLNLLECSLKKYTEEYSELVNELKKILVMEEDIYNKFGDNPAKLSNLLFKLFDCEQLSTVDAINYSIDNNVKELIKIRIGFRLEKLATEASFPSEEEYSEDNLSIEDEQFESFSDENEMYSSINREEAEKFFKYMTSIENCVEIDIINTILAILNKYIFDSNYQLIKPSLIRFKNMLSFVFRNIEQDFLENNFEIRSDLYWEAKLIVDVYGGNIEHLKNINEGFSEDIMYEHSINLLRLIFEDLNNIDNFASAILSEIIIRASLLFSNEKTIKNFRNFIICELNESKSDNKMIENIINRAIYSLDVDKELPKVISFKL